MIGVVLHTYIVRGSVPMVGQTAYKNDTTGTIIYSTVTTVPGKLHKHHFGTHMHVS